jgi:putative PIG3 family NAD(P)H quinone oxidoreductase
VQAITVTEPGGPEMLRLDEVPDPEPGRAEVLVRVAAAGVNRADLMQRQGHYPPPPGASELLGLEVSGVVARTGPDVSGWHPGQECVALLAGGGYAELVAVPAGQLLPVPERIDLITAAALVEVAATVVSNFAEARLAEGQSVLVHGGAGGIGSFAIPYAKALGATVLTTAGSEQKLAYCRSLGADLAISYREDWPTAVHGFTAGRGVDVILDVMGAKYLEPNVAALATGGRLLVIGLQGGRKGTLDLGTLMPKRGRVIATTLRARPTVEKAEICTAVRTQVWPLLSTGAIPPPRVTRFDLADAAEAHRRLESGENLGKIVLVVRDG